MIHNDDSMVPANAPATQFTAVIMAGSRAGIDPVAQASGKTHKCLVDVAGVPMLMRVLASLESCPHVGRIILCVEASFINIPEIDKRIADRELERLDAAGSPAASALRACEVLSDALPLLIVTADHPLLNNEILDHFCSHGLTCGDIGAGIARADMVLERYPASTRTLLRFADGARCGCNLFSINTPAARAAIVFWTQLEQERKRPWRLIRMLGVGALFRYLSGRLTLADALATLSRKLQIEAGAIEMPFAEAAIDVDKLSDLALVESILRDRAGIISPI